MSELPVSPEAQDEATSKEWYKSKGVWGSIIMVAAVAASYAGYNLTTDIQQDIVTAITDVVALGGAIMALIGRTVATKEIRG